MIKSIGNNKKVLSMIGFVFGLVGTFVSIAAFLKFINLEIISIAIPIIFGIFGFMLVIKSKKEINDNVVKIGLIINPVSIILGGLQIFL